MRISDWSSDVCSSDLKCGQLAAAWRKGLIGYQAFAELRRQTKRIAEQFREALLHHRLEIGCRDPRAGLGLRGIMFGDTIAIAATAFFALVGRHGSAKTIFEKGAERVRQALGRTWRIFRPVEPIPVRYDWFHRGGLARFANGPRTRG